jgi:ParB/RepB/Spo0J family partition protein
MTGKLLLKQLKPSPFNPRKTFDETKLGELAASITAHGVLQPILVRPKGKSPKLIDGEWSGVDSLRDARPMDGLRAEDG